MYITLSESYSLKNVYMLLRERLFNAQAKGHPVTTHLGSMGRREHAFTESVCDVMNQEILGSHNNAVQWKLLIEKQKGESTKIGMVNIENYHG